MDQMNVLTLLSTTALKLPVIISERNNPHHHWIGMAWEPLRHLLYPLATCLVVQSDSVLLYFSPKVRKHARIIPNPITVPQQMEVQMGLNSDNRAKKTIIAMGRLTEQKGFDLLLQAFAKVALSHPQWTIEIWGEGPLRPHLETLVHEWKLSDMFDCLEKRRNHSRR